LALARTENTLHDGGGTCSARHRGAQDNNTSTGGGTLHKLEFPKFDSKGDPLPRLNRCEWFFCLRHTPDDQKVAYATFNLLDDA
jgi:hypothetical protein